MRWRDHFSSWIALGALLLVWPALCAQPLVTSYDLIPATWQSGVARPEPALLESRYELKYAQPPSNPSNVGLSIGQWGARVGVTDDENPELMSIGGSYESRDGQVVSMQFMREPMKERLGLALRYEEPGYYLGLGYEYLPRSASGESFRFSAGIRF